MFDRQLRRTSARLLDPVVGLCAAVHPLWFTACGVLLGLAAAASAAVGAALVSALLWLLNRVADGVDGPIARQRGEASDRGGYLDIVADTVVYAAVPLGLALRVDDAWPATAVLLAGFYVNSVSWLYLSAVAERRARGAATTGETTTVHMPVGLVEGTETIVLYTAMLVLPQYFEVLAWVMAALVAVTVVQRVVGSRHDR
jgi:phosphatidylglycerophosphate synthase